MIALLTSRGAKMKLPEKKLGPLEKETTLFSSMKRMFNVSIGRRWKTKLFTINVKRRWLCHGKKVIDLNGKIAQRLEKRQEGSFQFGLYSKLDNKLVLLLCAVSEAEARDWICLINCIQEL